MSENQKLKGSCHCGNVKWEYPLKLESVTACNCTLCRRYGSLWAYGYIENGVKVFGETKFYQRGSKINGYHFCENCGCLTHYQAHKKNESEQIRIAVNLRMIEQPELIENLPIDHFEGLVNFEDLPRDQRCVKDLWF